jgi:hypothetical protein
LVSCFGTGGLVDDRWHHLLGHDVLIDFALPQAVDAEESEVGSIGCKGHLKKGRGKAEAILFLGSDSGILPGLRQICRG